MDLVDHISLQLMYGEKERTLHGCVLKGLGLSIGRAGIQSEYNISLKKTGQNLK